MSEFINNPRGGILSIDMAIFDAKSDNVKRIHAALLAKGVKLGSVDRYRYTWDEWELYALHEGLSAEMANLGRAVMRECMQHSWPVALWREVGPIAGMAMLAAAKDNPKRAKARWEHLLKTDGELELEWGAEPDTPNVDS